MMKLLHIVVMFVVVLALLFVGCDTTGAGGGDDDGSGDDQDDGTVTLSLSNAGGTPADSWFVVFVFEGGADPNTVDGLVAVNYKEISGGTVSDLVLEEPVNEYEPSGNDWIATGGKAYDLYAYTTADADLNYGTTSKVTSEYPETFTVDGDFTHTYDYAADLVDAPTLTIEVTGADMSGESGPDDSPEFTGAIVSSNIEPLAAYWDDIGPAPDYESSVLPQVTLDGGQTYEGGTWLYESGETYLVAFIVGPDSIDHGPETEGSYTLVAEVTLNSGHETVTEVFSEPSTQSNFDANDFELDTWYGPYTP
jgi:predicted small secreted protein